MGSADWRVNVRKLEQERDREAVCNIALEKRNHVKRANLLENKVKFISGEVCEHNLSSIVWWLLNCEKTRSLVILFLETILTFNTFEQIVVQKKILKPWI